MMIHVDPHSENGKLLLKWLGKPADTRVITQEEMDKFLTEHFRMAKFIHEAIVETHQSQAA